MKTSDCIFDILKQYGIKRVYFVPGGGSMHLVDSLGKSGLQMISALHEQGAGYMAAGDAMITGKLAVVLVTTGPGSTNALTPCAGCWTDSVPVLFISGQARTATLVGASGMRTSGVQEVDIIGMVQGITKICSMPKNGVDCIRDLRYMIQEALKERRGPAWLAVPLDVQGEDIDY